MRDFNYETPVLPLPITQIDSLLRRVVGAAYGGVSQSPERVRVHHEETLTGEQVVAILAVLQSTAYGLSVLADKLNVAADDADTATITISGAVMASDTRVDYAVYFTGTISGVPYVESDWASGTAAVTGGTATLMLRTPSPGSYHIVVQRADALHLGRVGITAL